MYPFLVSVIPLIDIDQTCFNLQRVSFILQRMPLAALSYPCEGRVSAYEDQISSAARNRTQAVRCSQPTHSLLVTDLLAPFACTYSPHPKPRTVFILPNVAFSLPLSFSITITIIRNKTKNFFLEVCLSSYLCFFMNRIYLPSFIKPVIYYFMNSFNFRQICIYFLRFM